VLSSTALISTELLCVVGVKNLVPSVCSSPLMLMQLSPLHLGKVVPLSPPLLSSWPNNPTMHCLSACFLKVIHAHVTSCVCG